jgi:hypothetical protein
VGNGHPDDVVPTTAIVPQAPVIDLNALGATVYQQNGFLGSNGDWSVSRLLVPYPTDSTSTSGQTSMHAQVARKKRPPAAGSRLDPAAAHFALFVAIDSGGR